jgi:branched-chain amino acid aminotransferase/para-aminobenzoate synthetase component 1
MNSTQAFCWLNDELIPVAQAGVSVEDRGFLYGDGFFETLRAEDGRVQLLAPHLERLRASAREFRLPFPDHLPWEDRLKRLLAANGLLAGLAAVKILFTRGRDPAPGLPIGGQPTLVLLARRYQPPPPAEYAAGWPLVTFPERRSTFLGRHKSLNYLFYLAARQYALDQGAREALVLEADGLVSEGAATNLVIAREDRYATPAAPSALPGVTLAALARELAGQGRELAAVPLRPEDLAAAQGIWLVNSLMGLMPVAALDGRPLPANPEAGRFLEGCLTAALAAG